MRRLALVLLATVAGVVPAAAHHRVTPPIVRFSSAGDQRPPRVASFASSLALVIDGQITRFEWNTHARTYIAKPVTSSGNNANASLAKNGYLTWDTDTDFDGGDDPARQIFFQKARGLPFVQLLTDLSGTGVNGAVDGKGKKVAFESSGGLTNIATLGTQHVYVRNAAGLLTQVSVGTGVSRNATLAKNNSLVVFESTSDPDTGDETTIEQIWIADTQMHTAAPITAGAGPSRNAAIESAGRVLVFESTADLATGGTTDTHIPQIFLYDTVTKTFAQITNDPGGCTEPSVIKIRLLDWRIAYACHGIGGFYELRADKRYEVPTPGGHTNRVVAELSVNFLLVSTTADLLNPPAVTAGHNLFLWNLFKIPGTPVAGVATWFPTRGIPPHS